MNEKPELRSTGLIRLFLIFVRDTPLPLLLLLSSVLGGLLGQGIFWLIIYPLIYR